MDPNSKHKRYNEYEALDIIMGMDSPSNSEDSLDGSTDSEESMSDEEFGEENDHAGRTTTTSGKRRRPRTRGGKFCRGLRTRGGRSRVSNPADKYLNIDVGGEAPPSTSSDVPSEIEKENNLGEEAQPSTTTDVTSLRQPVTTTKKPTVISNRRLPDIPLFEFTETEHLHIEVPDNVDPIFFFEQSCTEQLIVDRVEYTNSYAQSVINTSRPLRRRSRLDNWSDVDAPEMKTFVGLLISMGLVRLPNYQKYWSVDPLYKNNFFRSAMK